MLIKPTYTADTPLFVVIQNSSSFQELEPGSIFNREGFLSYVKTVDTPTVLQPGFNPLGPSVTGSDPAAGVKASSDLDTVYMRHPLDSILENSPGNETRSSASHVSRPRSHG